MPPQPSFTLPHSALAAAQVVGTQAPESVVASTPASCPAEVELNSFPPQPAAPSTQTTSQTQAAKQRIRASLAAVAPAVQRAARGRARVGPAPRPS